MEKTVRDYVRAVDVLRDCEAYLTVNFDILHSVGQVTGTIQSNVRGLAYNLAKKLHGMNYGDLPTDEDAKKIEQTRQSLLDSM